MQSVARLEECPEGHVQGLYRGGIEQVASSTAHTVWFTGQMHVDPHCTCTVSYRAYCRVASACSLCGDAHDRNRTRRWDYYMLWLRICWFGLYSTVNYRTVCMLFITSVLLLLCFRNLKILLHTPISCTYLLYLLQYMLNLHGRSFCRCPTPAQHWSFHYVQGTMVKTSKFKCDIVSDTKYRKIYQSEFLK